MTFDIRGRLPMLLAATFLSVMIFALLFLPLTSAHAGAEDAAVSRYWERHGGGAAAEADRTHALPSVNLLRTVEERTSAGADIGNAGTPGREPRETLASDRLWAATMTVGAQGSYLGYSRFGRSMGTLSETGFSHDGTDYTVYLALQDADNLHFGLNREAPTGLTMNAGDWQYSLDDATTRGGSGTFLYTWPKGDLQWSDGQTVDLSLAPTVEQTNNAPSGAPIVTGVAQVDQTLTVDTTGISDPDGLDNASFDYQWIRVDGMTDTDMAGQTGSGYTVVHADRGHAIKVRVSFTDNANNEETLVSAPTATVEPAPNRPASGSPTINGTVQAGQPLTADTTGIADADGLNNATFAYQWIRSDGDTDTDIQDAVAATYELTNDDVGKTVKVRASFADDRENQESRTSVATAVVVSGPERTINAAPKFAAPAISRSIAENSIPGTSVGNPVAATDLDGDTLAYTLEGADPDLFSVDAGGQLVVGDETTLDYESQQTHTVNVVATDPSGGSATATVTIRVTDVTDPNVVLILADDVGHEVFGAYGSTQYSTPRLDQIATAGALFTNAYSKPAATSSRIALMTGKSNVRNYVDRRTLSPGEFTIADLFSEAGYATAVAGKWRMAGTDDIPGIALGTGFDTYCLWLKINQNSRRYWNPSIECDGSVVATDAEDFGPDLFADFLIEFMQSNRKKPFFAYYPMVLAHHPFELPPQATCADASDDQCKFEDLVSYLDYSVGRVYDQLDTLDLLDNTVILFTADNGTHRMLVSDLGGKTIYGDKYRPNTVGTHVPLIVHAPGGEGGRVFDDLIDFTDFLPTLADAAGITVPDASALDGVSFWDRLQGRPGQPREWIYTYYFTKPYISTFNSPANHPETSYARDKQYQLYGTGELFDTIADPDELYPLPVDDPASSSARTKLQAALDSFPARGEAIIWSSVRGTPGEPRPRWRPVFSEATVDGAEMELTYAGSLNRAKVPPASSYTVQVDGSQRAVSGVSVGNRTVTLTLSSAVIAGQSVTVSYAPGTNALRHANRSGLGGYNAAPLDGETVSNLTATVPGTPANLRVVPHDAQGLSASWGAPADDGGSSITGYKVQWKEAADSWDTPADVSQQTVTGTTYTIGGLTNGVEYAVRVIAVNAKGDGAPSGERTGIPTETAAPVP